MSKGNLSDVIVPLYPAILRIQKFGANLELKVRVSFYQLRLDFML